MPLFKQNFTLITNDQSNTTRTPIFKSQMTKRIRDDATLRATRKLIKDAFALYTMSITPSFLFYLLQYLKIATTTLLRLHSIYPLINRLIPFSISSISMSTSKYPKVLLFGFSRYLPHVMTRLFGLRRSVSFTCNQFLVI